MSSTACLVRPFLLLAAIATVTSAPVASAASADATAAPTARLAPCTLPDVPRTARCGSIDVPENPDKPDGRRLSLKLIVIPARNGHALRDPIVHLSGGPGQAATQDAAFLSRNLASLSEERDLLLLDQRGTGDSAALPCALVDAADTAPNLRDVFPPAAVKRCARDLSATADISQYSLRNFAHDLETVRIALGYDALNLYGFSYGTRAAQVYLRTYPKTSRTAYLGSMAPIEANALLEFSSAAEYVLGRTFDACAADAACQAAFPALRTEFETLLARLDSGSVVVTAAGTNTKVTLTRGRFAERLRALLYSPESAASVPWLLHQAHEGNWQPWVDGMLDFARSMDAQIGMGLFFTITCNEDVAFLREADIRARVTPSQFGDFRVRSQQAACALWPRYTVPDGYRKPIQTDVPTMLVSSEFDPATPASLAARAAPGYSQRVELLLRGQGHSGWTDCAGERYAQLVRQGTVAGISTECPVTPRPAFQLKAEATPTDDKG